MCWIWKQVLNMKGGWCVGGEKQVECWKWQGIGGCTVWLDVLTKTEVRTCCWFKGSSDVSTWPTARHRVTVMIECLQTGHTNSILNLQYSNKGSINACRVIGATLLCFSSIMAALWLRAFTVHLRHKRVETWRQTLGQVTSQLLRQSFIKDPLSQIHTEELVYLLHLSSLSQRPSSSTLTQFVHTSGNIHICVSD